MWLPIGASLLLAFIGWRAVGIGMADWWSRQNPEAAMQWRADHAEAALQAAEVAVYGDPQSDSVARWARAAIAAYPLDGRPYRLLADAAGTPANLGKALHEIAAERSPRDYLSQAWVINEALRRRDFPRALAMLDRMLRARPEISHHLTAALAGLASTPEAQPAFAEMLARNPPWREIVLPRLIDAGSSGRVLGGLLQALRQREGGVAPAEQTAWFNRLVRDREYGAAYLAWIESLSPDQQQHIGNVYDGGFELAPSGAAFDWQFQDVAGARMDRLPIEGGTGKASLRVAFDERSVWFSHVSQLLLLAPGQYRLSGRERMMGMDEGRGLVWVIACVEDNKPLGQTPRLTGDHAWRAFNVDFEVPVQACAAQQLTLRVPEGSAASTKSGAAAFDDLTIERRYQ